MGCGPSPGVGERSADRAEKGRCSVTAEQSDSFWAATRVMAQKAELQSPWMRSWAKLVEMESREKDQGQNSRSYAVSKGHIQRPRNYSY